jgi:hypothetical protein
MVAQLIENFAFNLKFEVSVATDAERQKYVFKGLFTCPISEA